AVGEHVQGQLAIQLGAQLGDFWQQEDEGKSAGQEVGEENITHPAVAVPRGEVSRIGAPLFDEPRDGYNEKQVGANKGEDIDQLEEAKADGAALGAEAGKRDDSQRVGSQNPSEITYI